MVVKTSVNEVAAKEDPCGLLRELYKSESLSISHVEVLGDARKHRHRKIEEIYYVLRGAGQVVIGDKILDIKEGDLVPIPKGTWHFLKKVEGKPFEVLVVTHPKWEPSDMIFEP